MDNKLIRNFIQQLEDLQDGNNWLDENFAKKLDSITEENAFIRPIPEIHSIAELVGHILIWRLEGIKKLQGKRSDITGDSPENWRSNEELKRIGWEKLKTILFRSQQEVIELIKNESDNFLFENDYVPGYSYKYLLEGWVHHDIYHLGQIGITKKLLNKN